jgi:hypothetical protein
VQSIHENADWWLESLMKYFGPIAIWLIAIQIVSGYFFNIPQFIYFILGLSILILILFPGVMYYYTLQKWRPNIWYDYNKHLEKEKTIIIFLFIHFLLASSIVSLFLIRKMLALAITSADQTFVMTFGIIIFLMIFFGIISGWLRISSVMKSPNVFTRSFPVNFEIAQKNIKDALIRAGITYSYEYHIKSFMVPQFATFSINNSPIKIHIVSEKDGAEISITRVGEKETSEAEKLKALIVTSCIKN